MANNKDSGSWYKNRNYYIINIIENDNIDISENNNIDRRKKKFKYIVKYIGNLTSITEKTNSYGEKITTLTFNNIKDAETDQKIMKNDDVNDGKFEYVYTNNRDNMYDDKYSSKKWTLSLVQGSSAWNTDMGFGGSKRRRRTRKSRKVKRRRTHRVKRRRY